MQTNNLHVYGTEMQKVIDETQREEGVSDYAWVCVFAHMKMQMCICSPH